MPRQPDFLLEQYSADASPADSFTADPYAITKLYSHSDIKIIQILSPVLVFIAHMNEF